MPQLVEIPDIGEVEFPDSMTEADIAAASSNLYAQRKGVPPIAQPLAIPPPPPDTPEGRRLAAELEEAPESGLRTLGRGMSALGRYGRRVTMGAAQDIGALLQRGPAGIGEPQTLAALAGGIPSGAPEALSAEGTTAAGEPPKPLGERVIVGAIRGVGEMAPALAGAAVTGGATLPAWFAGQMGLSAYGETGDPGLATRQAAVGALMGQFSRYGSAIGEAAGLRAAAKLPAALENATIEAGKFAGQQAALNYLMTTGNLPELMQEPDKAIDRLAEQVGINLAFAAPHLPEQARRAFSRDWAEQMVRSPEYRRTLDEAARLSGQPIIQLGVTRPTVLETQRETAEAAQLLRRGLEPTRQREKPTVPETPAQAYQTAIQEVRGANARTIGEIQRLFSQRGLSREEARAFRNAAWGTPAEERLAPQTTATIREPVTPTEAPKAPETVPGVSEPLRAPEPAPTAPPVSAVGVPMTLGEFSKNVKVRETLARGGGDFEVFGVPSTAGFWGKTPDEAVRIAYEKSQQDPSLRSEILDTSARAKTDVRAATAPIPEQPVKAGEAIPKAQAVVSQIARTEGRRSAQDIKDELVAKLQDALQKAPSEATGESITIEIPEDGVFTIRNNVEAISEVLEKAQKLKVKEKAPGVPRSIVAAQRKRGFPARPIEQYIREREVEATAEPSPVPEQAPLAPETAPLVPKETAPAPTEPAISFPGIGSLREKQATAMELGKIRKAEPELWKAITSYFGETSPSRIAKGARDNFQRQREAQSRAASAGPGAASPVEFEQRARAQGDAAAAGQKPPGDSPPVTTDASASPSIAITRANRDYNILNRVNSGQFAFWFGKLGEAAKQAWERMALGEFRMRESIGRDTKRYVDQLLDGLPRPFRKKGGEAFFDVVNGKKFEDIEAEWSGRDGGAEVIAAAREFKTRLEEIRTTIRDTKREAYTAYLNSLDRPILEGLFKKNIDEQLDISGYPKESIADALVKDAYRDDWGIADGSYLPHLFFGNWKVTATDAAGESRFVTRSKTPEEAKAEIYKFVQRNPELKDADFKVEQDTVVPADMIRLGDRRFWQLVGKMKEATGMTQGEVREAQQGIIGKKSSKQKWFGSLQKREGYEGYSRDYRQVMTAYLSGFHRWLELSQMQRDVQPLIETVRREGRQNAATRLDEIMDNLWGKPARTTMEFDAIVRQIPGLRDYIKPLALERWSRNARNAVAMATLKTLRFALINRLQPLQGLYPLVGERILAQAKIVQHTKEGRALLDEAGVSFDPGQYRAERAGVGKLQTLSERFSGEKSNQELAFLAMFQHGIERGLSRADAIKYAKLRGQLFTQFTPLIADTPQLLQGPFAGLLFQFKRFPVKQAELLTRLVQEKQIGGIARWLGVMALAGGASYFLRQVYADAEKKKRLRDNLAEQHGEKVADTIMYGLPGLVGADLSGSLVLGDEPFGANLYEKAGRSIAGPAAGIVIDTARQIATPRREPTTTRQDAVALLKRFPTTRPLAELLTLEDSDLDVRTPDGEVRYRKTLKDALLGLGSFRSANASNIKLALDAMIELKKEITTLKNQYFVESEQGDTSKSDAAIDKFNERWPELEITPRELLEYSELRRRGLDKTDVERISGKKLKSLAP